MTSKNSRKNSLILFLCLVSFMGAVDGCVTQWGTIDREIPKEDEEIHKQIEEQRKMQRPGYLPQISQVSPSRI